MNTFKVVVAGSRGFNDYELLKNKLSYYLKNKHSNDIEIVSGGARGADKLGERYANEFNLKTKVFLADWNQYGKAAGHIRNREMAKYTDVAVVFWDGQSPGSLGMIQEMNKLEKRVIVVQY